MLLLKLGWRNSLRNRRRTFLTGLAIGMGLAGLIFSDALIIGLSETMVRTATDTFLGQAVINHEDFRDTLEIEKTVVHGDEILKQLESVPEIKHFTSRAAASAMIRSASDTSAVVLYGIDPKREPAMSKVDDAIIEGSYLQPGGEPKILISRHLADLLDVQLGDGLVVTVAQAETGDLQQALFLVGGIFNFGVREMDAGLAFVSLNESQKLFGLEGRFHEIAIEFTELDLASDKSLPLWDKYSKDGNQTLNWKEVMPELAAALKMTDISIAIMSTILFGVVVLGIMNTLFMSLYERMFEFGVLRAVGTRPLKMAIMILIETGVLALASIAIGCVLGFGVSLYFSQYGIDYSGVEFAGVTFGDPIIPVMSIHQYVKYPLVLLAFAMVVGVYPAIYAARMKPVTALHKTL